jgi:prevent-host-death family protein
MKNHNIAASRHSLPRGTSSLGTDTMRKRMGEVLDSVYFRGDEFIIERKHKPLAVLISIEKFNTLNKFAKEVLVGTLNKYTTPDMTDDEVEVLVNDAKHANLDRRR